MIPPQLINDPTNYHSYVSTRFFLQQQLLPAPEDLYERDFALIGAVGTDYTTHESIRKVFEALRIPHRVGYPAFYSITQRLAKTWRNPVTVNVKTQKGLKSKSLKVTLPGTRNLPFTNQPTIDRSSNRNHITGSSTCTGNMESKGRPASQLIVSNAALISGSIKLSNKSNSSPTTLTVSDNDMTRSSTSNKSARVFPRQAREESEKNSQPFRTAKAAAIPFNAGVLSMSSKFNSVGKEDSATLERNYLQKHSSPNGQQRNLSIDISNSIVPPILQPRINSQASFSTTTRQPPRKQRIIVDLITPTSSPQTVLDQGTARFVVECTISTSSSRPTYDREIQGAQDSSDPVVAILPPIISSTPHSSVLPFQLQRSADKSIPLSVQSLKDLTGRLLCAHQRGRANDWHHLWRILPYQEKSPAGTRSYYRAFYDDQLVSGLRLILLNGEFNSGLKLCAYGCERNGKVQWITSSRLVLLI